MKNLLQLRPMWGKAKQKWVEFKSLPRLVFFDLGFLALVLLLFAFPQPTTTSPEFSEQTKSSPEIVAIRSASPDAVKKAKKNGTYQVSDERGNTPQIFPKK